MIKAIEDGTNAMCRPFGHMPDGTPIECWRLEGRGGLAIEVITYGGIIRSIEVPTPTGTLDVALGFDTLEAYLAGHPFFGAITGRIAGRVSGARMVVEGVEYALSPSQPPNHLHGGFSGLDKKVWQAEPKLNENGEPALALRYTSPDGDEGYPGRVDFTVRYSVLHDNTLLIETEAVSDRVTPVSLTNHTYFNLAGEGSGDTLDHTLQVMADRLIATEENFTLISKLESVDGRPEDLREAKLLRDAVPGFFRQHGGLYALPEEDRHDRTRVVARLHHPASGRTMLCATDNTHLQVYTGFALQPGASGKSGAQYGPFAGIALECEGYAEGANAPWIGDIMVRPGEPQRRYTAFRFIDEPQLETQ